MTSKTKYIFGVILFLSFVICFGQNDSSIEKNKANESTELEFIQIHTIAETPARPQISMDAFRKYLASSFKLPEVSQTTLATVNVKFVVWNDGTIKDVQIIKETPEGLGLGKEAIRVLNNAAKWIPAEQGGKKVNQYFSLPIKIEIPATEKNQKTIEENKETLPLVTDTKTITAKDSIEIKPEPQEGFQKFYSNLQNRIMVPDSSISGTYRTIVSFVVEKDGTLSDYKIIKETPSPIGLGEEVIRVLKTFPKWKPGSARTPYVLPVTTVIENDPEPEPTPKKE